MAFSAVGPGGASLPSGIIEVDPLMTKDPLRWVAQIKKAAGGALPRYLMLVGGPDIFPFALDEVLSSDHLTGRLDVSSDPVGPISWVDCGTYARKVVDYETGKVVVSRRVVLFSPIIDGPTETAHRGLIEPLRDALEVPRIWMARRFVPEVVPLLSENATTDRLSEELEERRPMLVVSATHGYERPYSRRMWGAFTDATCKRTNPRKTYFSADGALARMAREKPFGQGAVLLSFACFSAGVPEKGAYALFTSGTAQQFPEAPFVAPLPRVLLSYEHGPIAFIGHVDAATSQSFMDGIVPQPGAFKDFLDWALPGFGTLARAMQGFRERAWKTAVVLSDKLSSAAGAQTFVAQAVLNAFIRYHDARGYLLLGDPAIRMAAPAAE